MVSRPFPPPPQSATDGLCEPLNVQQAGEPQVTVPFASLGENLPLLEGTERIQPLVRRGHTLLGFPNETPRAAPEGLKTG